ncbi:cupin domain-containing protein [Nocardioides sp. TRM66260-LWL]|nr:cupin domain-containing protein [Nocardioides sp. TRM66260-LWL]MBZ5734170.1 cupin domain-containing protein [Nocardioides sp. TRM66260-LWL]
MGHVTTADDLVRALDLAPHPEGGHYRRTWTSPVTVTLPDGRTRPTATLIAYLLPAGAASAWHRVASDEVWIAGAGTVRLELGGAGAAPAEVVEARLLGVAAPGEPQVVVPAGTWQRTLPTDADALVSCLVSPGFDFADWELAPER